MDMVTAGDGGVRRVVRVDHASCLVTDPAGPVRARAPMPVAVGDWVELSGGPDPTVAAVLARRTAVTRRDPTGQTQVLAANVDLVLVTAPADRLSLARVEREVTIGWDSGARPAARPGRRRAARPDPRASRARGRGGDALGAARTRDAAKRLRRTATR